MDNIDVLKGHKYTDLKGFVDRAENGSLEFQDRLLADELQGSLSLGFCRRLQVIILNVFGANDTVAKLVAEVVKPLLGSLKPAQAAPRVLKSVVAEPKAPKAVVAAPKAVVRTPSPTPSYGSTDTSSGSSSPENERQLKACVASEKREQGRKVMKKPATQAPMTLDGKTLHIVQVGGSSYQITSEKELENLLFGFIKPGVSGGLNSQIEVDGKKVVIANDPVLKAAFERAKMKKDKERESVHQERSDYSQHASIVLADQVAAAARRRNRAKQ